MAYTKLDRSAFNGLESWVGDDDDEPRILFVTDSYDDELREFWCGEWPGLYNWLMTNEPICPEIGTKGDIALIVRLG
jgi:hypothetical protein